MRQQMTKADHETSASTERQGNSVAEKAMLSKGSDQTCLIRRGSI